MQHRRSLQENAQSQVRSVCTDTALNPEQRLQKIREIRQSTHQQVMALLNPQEQQAVQQCERANRGPRPGMHAPGARSPDPCTEMK